MKYIMGPRCFFYSPTIKTFSVVSTGKLKMTSSSEISSDEQAKLPSLSNTMHPFLTPKLKIHSLKRSSDVHTESTPFSSNMQPFFKGTLKITPCKGSTNRQMESAPLSSTMQPLLSLINLTGSRGKCMTFYLLLSFNWKHLLHNCKPRTRGYVVVKSTMITLCS